MAVKCAPAPTLISSTVIEAVVLTFRSHSSEEAPHSFKPLTGFLFFWAVACGGWAGLGVKGKAPAEPEAHKAKGSAQYSVLQ